MPEHATLEDFKKEIVAEHMPKDPIAQAVLEQAIQLLMLSIHIAREHAKEAPTTIVNPFDG